MSTELAIPLLISIGKVATLRVKRLREREQGRLYCCVRVSPGPGTDPVHTLPQSRRSAKLFLQSSELGLPLPLKRRGVGRVPIPTRGHTLW